MSERFLAFGLDDAARPERCHVDMSFLTRRGCLESRRRLMALIVLVTFALVLIALLSFVVLLRKH